MSNYSIQVPCGCEVIAGDIGVNGYVYQLEPCALHGAAEELAKDAARLALALLECATRLERCAIVGGTTKEFAVEAVREYRELVSHCKKTKAKAEKGTTKGDASR